jgi:hypothetical protein
LARCSAKSFAAKCIFSKKFRPFNEMGKEGERRGVSPTWMLQNTSGLRLDARHQPPAAAWEGDG